MSENNSAKMFKSMLIAGAAATTAFAALAAAPTIFSATAEAQRIDPPRVAPPGGAPGSFADLIQKVSPAVVSIQVRQRPNASRNEEYDFENLPPGFEEFLRRFPQQGPQRAPQALGSGFIIDQSGLVVTNNHVVENAEEIDVTTSEGKQLKADLIGTDESTDLAVLRIRGENGRFPFVQLDRSPTVRVGDWVVAVGNPFGLDGTATAGIVSATGRRDFSQTGSSYVDFLQIDAPINRGNSGGPTFDLRGNVIGVNSAIFSPTGGNVGIGFAIPSDTAARVVDQLIKSGKVSRGWLGVQIQAIDPEIAKSLGLEDDNGAIVASVTAGSPAADAGFQQGDVVLRFNGQVVEDSRDLTRKVGATEVGRSTRVDVLRNGRRIALNVTLGERPSEQQLASLDTSAPNATTGQETSGLGLSVRPATDEDRRRVDMGAVEGGLVITSVADNSALAERGVVPGDVIVGAGPDRRPLRSVADLNAAVEEARRDDRPVLLSVQGRVGPPRYVAVEVKAG